MRNKLILATLLATVTLSCFAGTDPDSIKLQKEAEKLMLKKIDSVKKAMKYETGLVSLPCSIAHLNVPKGFKYLGSEQARYVTEELWGNPNQTNIQGMIFPENSDPFDDTSYAYVISYNPIGYVKDDDAKDINYTKLMEEMKADDAKENNERRAAGAYALYTEGWAAPPFYDPQNKVLHWAINLRMEGAEENTLNYQVIFLGRKGILTMNAVAPIGQLKTVQKDVDKVLHMAAFTEGNKYSDFDSKVDNVAAWTVGGLVAGKILAKTAAGVGILKFLKFIILGIAAAGGAIWRFITGKKKKEEELVYQPQPTSNDNNPEQTQP